MTEPAPDEQRPQAGEPVVEQASEKIAIIADDDEFFRLALASLLTRNLGFTTVIETGSLDEALTRLADQPHATLALFDLRMPGMQSAASLSAVRECFPQVKAAILSASTSRRDILLALDAGAHGYIPKIFSAAEVVRALGLILDGLIFVPALLAEAPGAGLAPLLARPVDAKGAPDPSASLTRRQRDVLGLIVEGKSNKEIARGLGLCEGTVKVHVAALLRVLEVSNRAGAAVAGARALGGAPGRRMTGEPA